MKIAQILLMLTILSALQACTAINMQSFYKLEPCEQVAIEDKTSKQRNPTPPAYFISFADDHVYQFAYKELVFEILTPIHTNKSTLLGPLIFPIFPVGMINDMVDSTPRRDVVKIYVHDDKHQYSQEKINNIIVLDLDRSIPVLPEIDKSSANIHTLRFFFDDHMPSRFKLLFESINCDGGSTPGIVFRKVYRPSVSAGVW